MITGKLKMRSREVPKVSNALRDWTVAAAYELPWIPVQLVSHYSWFVGGSSPLDHVWRFQVQYVFAQGMPLSRPQDLDGK